MVNSDTQFVGGPCGHHGPYTFYKAFKFAKNGVWRIVTLSDFFFVKMWRDSDLLCIGELQLLWIDKNSEQMLASLRLYFLPENTPEGRLDHGEDEVLAITEKVVIRVEDLTTLITVEAEWTWGRIAKCEQDMKPIKDDNEENVPPRKPAGSSFTIQENLLDYSDVEMEKNYLEKDNTVKDPHVIILSFPKYCRYRAMMKRLDGVEDIYLKYKIVNALGGFYVIHPNTRVLFCRDTFDYPELEGHELLCNHLAPKLKGRPRGKRKKRSISPGSESNESESSITISTKVEIKTTVVQEVVENAPRRSTRCHENNENKEFVQKLGAFMKSNRTPIGRIPSLGYKELNLHEFYTRVQKLGGYDCVTTNRLWKSIFDEMSGHQNSTSAATIIRRHYERFLLPYERHQRGEEYKPLSVSERRRLKHKRGSGGSLSDAESSSDGSIASTSRKLSASESLPDIKEIIKPEGKPSSLRSVRVKPDRQKDKQLQNDKDAVNNNNNNNNNNEKWHNPEEKTIKPEPVIVKTDTPSLPTPNQPSPPQEDNPKTEPEPSKPEEDTSSKPETETTSLKTEPPDTNPARTGPDTSAATPIVPVSELKSPAEGKESLPVPKEPETVPNNFINEFKKRKLDILKEGGLEVTPVRTSTIKDGRPTVIQPPPVQLIPTKPTTMPPPTAVPLKRTVSHSTPIKKPPSFTFPNGITPPKVVQSRSIYSYSEKTVYGNPKDILNPIAPRFIDSLPPRQPSGGHPVDLSVNSPQKPIVEIMRIPQTSSGSSSTSPFNRDTVTKNLYKTNSIMDGRRLGPNLEITLVGPNYPKTSTSTNKRPSTEYHKVNKGEENGRYKRRGDVAKQEVGRQHPSQHVQSPNVKQFNPPSQQFPPSPYMSPYMPFIDPSVYYTAAMQNLYAGGSFNSVPVLPMPTAEQLKMYAELMAHGRMPYPFQMPQDVNKLKKQ